MDLSHYHIHRGRTSTVVETPVVFVVDDDFSVRKALESLIRSARWQAKTFVSAEEFLEQPLATGPGCLVAEVNLPGLSGLELQKLVTARTALPIIFLSGHADVRATVQAMKAGAFEFLTKPYVADALLHTIRQAIERSRAVLRELTQIRALEARYGSLSRREREVMSLVLTGRLNKQVGGTLGISEITVKAHRGRVMRKMQAASFAELMNMAATLHAGSQPARLNGRSPA